MQFTPTVQHCSMATLIGLCIRVKLLRSLPPRFKVSRPSTPPPPSHPPPFLTRARTHAFVGACSLSVCSHIPVG